MPACILFMVAFPQPARPAATVNFCSEYGGSHRMRPGVESLESQTSAKAKVRHTNRLQCVRHSRSEIFVRRASRDQGAAPGSPARSIDFHARPRVKLRGELMTATCRYHSADVLRADRLMTDRKILGSKSWADVRGFSILA